MRKIVDGLKAPVTFPVELTLTTGQCLRVLHRDFTSLNPNTGDLWHFPADGPIAVIDPAHIAKVEPQGPVQAV